MPDAQRVIGVLPSYTGPGLNANAFFQGCIGGVLDGAHELGWDALMLVSRDFAGFDTMDACEIKERMAGVVMVGPPVDGVLPARLLQAGVPLTFVASRSPSAICVSTDNAAGVALAVDHLLKLGHERIAHLHGPLDRHDAVERLEAFTETMRSRGASVAEGYVVEGGFDETLGNLGMSRLIWISERPTAVLCANDAAAVGAVRAIWESGLRVPADISVVGFDGTVLSEASFPKLTSVRQPWAEMGSSAMRKLVDMIEGRPAESEVLPCELLVRQSTSRPGEDPFRTG